MNVSGNSMDGAALRVRKVFASQRTAFKADPYPLAEPRRLKIKALKRQLGRYQDVLADAMSKDFGFRAPTEVKNARPARINARGEPRCSSSQTLDEAEQAFD